MKLLGFFVLKVYFVLFWDSGPLSGWRSGLPQRRLRLGTARAAVLGPQEVLRPGAKCWEDDDFHDFQCCYDLHGENREGQGRDN